MTHPHRTLFGPTKNRVEADSQPAGQYVPERVAIAFSLAKATNMIGAVYPAKRAIARRRLTFSD